MKAKRLPARLRGQLTCDGNGTIRRIGGAIRGREPGPILTREERLAIKDPIVAPKPSSRTVASNLAKSRILESVYQGIVVKLKQAIKLDSENSEAILKKLCAILLGYPENIIPIDNLALMRNTRAQLMQDTSLMIANADTALGLLTDIIKTNKDPEACLRAVGEILSSRLQITSAHELTKTNGEAVVTSDIVQELSPQEILANLIKTIRDRSYVHTVRLKMVCDILERAGNLLDINLVAKVFFRFHKADMRFSRDMDCSRFFDLITPVLVKAQNKSSVIDDASFSFIGLGLKSFEELPENFLSVFAELLKKRSEMINVNALIDIPDGLARNLRITKTEYQYLLDIAPIINKKRVQIIDYKLRPDSSFTANQLVQALKLIRFALRQSGRDNSIIEYPSKLEEYYKAQLPYRQKQIAKVRSMTEKIAEPIFQEFEGLLPSIANIFIDGCEIDRYFPEQKVRIELDGFQHKTSTVIDGIRDQYLEQCYCIKTLRIDILESDWQIKLRQILTTMSQSVNSLHRETVLAG